MTMDEAPAVEPAPRTRAVPWRFLRIAGVVLGSVILGAVVRGVVFPPEPDVEVQRVEVAPVACTSLVSAYNDQLAWAADAGRILLAFSEAHSLEVPTGAGLQAYLDAYETRTRRISAVTDDLDRLVDRSKVLVSAGTLARDSCASESRR